MKTKSEIEARLNEPLEWPVEPVSSRSTSPVVDMDGVGQLPQRARRNRQEFVFLPS